MAKLIVLQGGQATAHPITEEDTIIGRHPACGLQLHSNTVSRRHAHVFREEDGYYLEDLGSGNGTFINGKQIAEKTRLKHQDRIKLGPMLLRFESEDAPESAAAGSPMPRSSSPGHLEQTDLDVDYKSGDDDDATIMGTVATTGGFGVLDVQPEAKLKAVLSISRSLAGTVEVEKILPRILDTLFETFPYADRGCILLKDDESGEMIPRAIKHRRADEDASVKLSRTIVSKVLTEKSGILSADAASDTQFEASESISSLSIRSMMCVPLLSLEGEPMGILNIDTLNPLNQFQNEDLDLLMAVAGQAAMSYESARLMASFLQKQKQDNEMEIARGVQRALLPDQLPELEGYEFYASYDSAQAVGGDYYDAMTLSDGKICLSFGDVAGKGVPGALIMSRMSSCVQNTMEFVSEVADAIGPINNHMCANAVEGRFVTYCLITIDPKTNLMTLANAGHMSPMILKPDRTIEEFHEDSIGLPVGVVEDYPFDVVTRTVEPGETIVLFTDGVDEAMNPAGELYTLERMRDFIAKASPKADELGKALLADVRRHANGRPQNDDITIMTFGRNA
ncbi:MAG: stage II sporulation protein E [Planctomycetaceae bacterium]|nr:stage II sporulation protein E [Planctomycetaceae bacterium]